MPAAQINDYVVEQASVPTAANDNLNGFVIALEDQPIEGGFDPAFGDVTWRTLISAERRPSSGVILGVANFRAYGVLHLHRHTPAEFYFVLSGSGTVMLDGQPVDIVSGSAVFIPSNAEHGVTAGPDGLTFAYGFGEDAFSEVDYRFSAG